MKFIYGMTSNEKAEMIRKSILRNATALYNACKIAKENHCKGCPFDVGYGCALYGHPIEWREKINDAKTKGANI